MEELKVGVYSAKVELIRSEEIIEAFKNKNPGIRIKRIVLRAELKSQEEKVKLLNDALISGKIDIGLTECSSYLNTLENMAIHDDARCHDDVEKWLDIDIAGFGKRTDTRTVMILKKNRKGYLPDAKIDADHKIRQTQMNTLYDEVSCGLIDQGLVNAIRDVKESKLDGVIIPADQIKMLKLHRIIGLRYIYYKTTEFVPMHGQSMTAILAVNNSKAHKIANEISDYKSYKEFHIEQIVMDKVPNTEYINIRSLCVNATIDKDELTISAFFESLDKGYRISSKGEYSNRTAVVNDILHKIMEYVEF